MRRHGEGENGNAAARNSFPVPVVVAIQVAADRLAAFRRYQPQQPRNWHHWDVGQTPLAIAGGTLIKHSDM
jgi:hypothetical protein